MEVEEDEDEDDAVGDAANGKYNGTPKVE